MSSVRVVVTGIGLISALGDLQPTWQRLLKAETGIHCYQPFPELPAYPLGLIDNSPLGRQRHGPTTVRFLIQELVTAALLDAGLTCPLPDCGVVIGSSRGHQGVWEQWACQFQHTGSLPQQNWLQTLPQAPAMQAAQMIGSQGPLLAPMAACATGVWAIAQGYELIQTGQCQRVLVGAVEAPITPLTLSGFAQMGALATTAAYPFDTRRDGLVLAEGGAILVLETETLAQQRAASIYGYLCGFGLANDAENMNAPSRDQRGAIAALQHCLQRSGRSPAQIGYIHAHGTATRLNDGFEAQLIQRFFPQGVAVSSTKGATGHTLGASGALGAVFCLLALKHQILPPCVGLEHPEFDLDLIRQPRSVPVTTALCFAFGFGGQNAMLALSHSQL